MKQVYLSTLSHIIVAMKTTGISGVDFLCLKNELLFGPHFKED